MISSAVENQTDIKKQAIAQCEADVSCKAQALQVVYDYHERSKHRFSAYAKGPESLDWDAQPNPFRVYENSRVIELPLDELSEEITYARVLEGEVEARELSLLSIAQLLRLSFGITAWKELPDGTRWALRANPSSGNLHPTEVWLLLRGVTFAGDGLYHYDCRNHALELRCEFLHDIAAENKSSAAEIAIAFSTIYWREAWKYGERAFRYCHLDIGHAAAALGFSCRALGWSGRQIPISRTEFDTMLGLTRTEHEPVEEESALCLFQIETRQQTATANPTYWLKQTSNAVWQGLPNRLDAKPMYQWPAIAAVAAATRAQSSPADVAEVFINADKEFPADTSVNIFDTTCTINSAKKFADENARTVACISVEDAITLRRSAQAYDSRYALSREQFTEILSSYLYSSFQPLAAFQSAALAPRIHLVLIVHNVRDLTPGVYVLPRSARGENLMRQQLTRWNDWVDADIAVGEHKLFRIKTANTQRAAATLCCQQRIASDSCFVTGFLAEFDSAIDSAIGAAQAATENYCELFQEAGALAHTAYLRAAALGFAGTGIGCFFDDEWHELLGIQNKTLQFVYFFAAGKPIVDTRLMQRAGYFHLADQQQRFLRRFA